MHTTYGITNPWTTLTIMGNSEAMFSIYMPATFKVGDTADTTINGERRRLHYKDAETLVIEPGKKSTST